MAIIINHLSQNTKRINRLNILKVNKISDGDKQFSITIPIQLGRYEKILK